MDSEHDGVRMKVEGDRLSTLPDDIIFKILALVGFRQAIETSALSSRWRYLWTSMPCLHFSDEDFRALAKLSKFVKGVLSGRNNRMEVSSVNLTIRRRASSRFVQGMLNKVLYYALSHNVHQLNINCTGVEAPVSPFSSQSLKHLNLNHFTYKNSITTPSTWKLLALTTLNLRSVTLYNDNNDKSADIFSNCANLKNLTLNDCKIRGSNGFNISHPGLSDLTLICFEEGGNVVTPQLKNLTIRNWGRGIHLISAPNLAFLQYKGAFNSLQFSGELLHLEESSIDIYRPFEDKANAHKVVCLFQQLHSVKFLTLDFELFKFLSSYVELISHQPSPFANLKSLKIYPYNANESEEQTPLKVMSTEVKNYLLDGSPGATFTMVLPEEVIAMKKTKLAQKLSTELRALLQQENASMETKMVKMHELGKAHIDIDSCWKHLSVHFEKGKETASNVITKLNRIKGLLGELSASNRDTIQPSFSTLCAEANIVMNKITDCVKSDCDENQRRLSVCFSELATTLEPSS
ncbi:putative F-box/FBD/LRR-repeat protein At4g13965 [Bidens hawaiensis]|uniref:putative F-box/FBD/LRR-repeat protein At4g13965 n=1 Tax=Bidens hawaiensis TaxID=980011 RepID=UPI004049036B